MRFEILTNKTWTEFYSDMGSRLRINLDDPLPQIAYRLHYGGMCSNYSPLDLEVDWCLAMMEVCRRRQDNLEVEIDILKLKKRVRIQLIYYFKVTNSHFG